MKLFFKILFLLPVFYYPQDAELLLQKGHDKKINAITFSPDGTFFATGGDDNQIILTETKTGISYKTIHEHKAKVQRIIITADGKKMISLDHDDVLVWDLVNQKLLFTITDSYANDYCYLSASPDSKELFVGGDHYDLTTGKKTSKIKAKYEYKNIFSPDGNNILFIRSKVVDVWDIKSSTVKFTLATQSEPKCFFITGDGKYYYCANEYAVWQKWNLTTGQLEETREGMKDSKESIVYGHFMVVNDQHTLFAVQNYYDISIYDLWSGKLLNKTPYGREEKNRVNFTAAAFNPAGDVLVCGMHVEAKHKNDFHEIVRVRYVDTKSGRTIMETKGFESSVTSISIAPDDQHISIMGDQAVRIWEMDKTGGEMISLSEATKGTTKSFWSPDSKVIYTTNSKFGDYRYPHFLYDLNTMQFQKDDIHFSYQNSKGTSFVADDFKTAVGKTRVVDFETGKPICEIDMEKDITTTDFIGDGKETGEIKGSAVITNNNKTLVVVKDPMTTYINIYSIADCKKTGAFVYESCPDGHEKCRITVDHYGREPVFAVNNGKLLAVGVNKIGVFDVTTQKQILEIPAPPTQEKGVVVAMALNKKENILAVSYMDTSVVLYEIPSGKALMKLTGHKIPVLFMQFKKNSDMLLTASSDGQIKFWNTISGEQLGTLVPVDSTDFILTTTGNYYYATRGALRNMAFKVGKKCFPFEQFDLKYNRPDKVFEALGLASNEQIKTYNMAYKKRLQKTGFTEEMLSGEYHLPTTEVKNKFDIPLISKKEKLTFTVSAADDKYKLNRLNVFVNDVAVYGSKGMVIAGNLSQFTKDIDVNLSNGMNHIQVSVTNEHGVESLREAFEITCDKGTKKPDLYMLVVGVSEYKESDNNLKYAAKDAQDLVKSFEANPMFNKKNIKLITNADATKENVLKEAKMFSDSKEDDMIIIYVSGHGVLDDKLDYYLAMNDMSFTKPAEKGLPYGELENMIEKAPSRNRLILIDACHSGEVDKDETQLASTKSVDNTKDSKIVFRGVGKTAIPKTGLASSFTYMQALFDDVSKGVGATVISAAGGMEYALESSDWNNGVFTYSILNGIQSNTADLNKNGTVSISELKQYVTETVIKLTDGRQVPNARKENLNNDFIIH